MKQRKSKRFTLSIAVITAYLLIGAGAYYVHPEHMAGLATYMTATSIPVVGYILGESWRPSNESN